MKDSFKDNERKEAFIRENMSGQFIHCINFSWTISYCVVLKLQNFGVVL